MTDNDATLPSEIEESTTSDETNAGSTNTDKTSNVDETEKDLSLDTLNSNVKKPESDYSNTIAESWAKQIRNGERSANDLDLADHKWLKEPVSKLLNGSTTTAPQSGGSVEEQFNSLMVNKDFEASKQLIETFPTNLRNKIIREAKENANDGADIRKTFNRLVAENKSKAQDENDTTEVRKTGQGLPKGNTSTGTRRTYTQEQLSSLSQDEYNRVTDMATKGEVIIK